MYSRVQRSTGDEMRWDGSRLVTEEAEQLVFESYSYSYSHSYREHFCARVTRCSAAGSAPDGCHASATAYVEHLHPRDETAESDSRMIKVTTQYNYCASIITRRDGTHQRK